MKEAKAKFINSSNGRLYKRKGKSRHHTVVCTYCKDFKRFKLLKAHFKQYHPGELEKLNKTLANSLKRGQIGIINGIRFITT